jgi:hypothetical protein
MQWVRMFCKADSRGLGRLGEQPEGPAMFGVSMLLLQVAAKTPVRGVLAGFDGPYSAEDIAFKTRMSSFATLFARAIDVLSDPRLGWIAIRKWDPTTSFDNNIRRLVAAGDIVEPISFRQRKTTTHPATPPPGAVENISANGTSRLSQWFGGSNGRRH